MSLNAGIIPSPLPRDERCPPPPGSLRAGSTESVSVRLPGRGRREFTALSPKSQGCAPGLTPEHGHGRPQAPLRKQNRLRGCRRHHHGPAWSAGPLLLRLHPPPPQELKGFQYSLDGGTLTPLLAKPSSGHPSLSHPLTAKQFMEEGVALGAQDLHAPRHSPTTNLHLAFKVQSGPVLIHPTEKNPKCVRRLSYGLLSTEI